jgi:probable phosphoglycerate mutase
LKVFTIRHGETTWSLSGQHTGTTDIPLTDNGRRLAGQMRQVFATSPLKLVLCSPMRRARETCELAGWPTAPLSTLIWLSGTMVRTRD